MAKCIPQDRQKSASKACQKKGMVVGFRECELARQRVCPPPDVMPSIEEGKDGIRLLGTYTFCGVQPTLLAPYPPSKPTPAEAAAQTALDRMTGQAQTQVAETMKLKRRAARASKITLGWGFWLGVGLVGLGGTALYLRR